jgi:hypothetical protein
MKFQHYKRNESYVKMEKLTDNMFFVQNVQTLESKKV